MKKHVVASLVLSLLFSFNVNAQSFEKGSINVDLGLGFGVYGTSQSATTGFSVDINGTPLVLLPETTRDTNDGAASTIIPISFEYGISDKIGLGVDLMFSNYFIDKEDKEFLNSIKGFDFGIKGYYHIVNTDKYDLSVGVGLGVSKINWKFNSIVDLNTGFVTAASEAKGNGAYWNLEVKNKFFFSENVGIFVSVGYRGYSYSAVERDHSSEEAQIEALSSPGFEVTNANFKDEVDFKFNGVNLGLGLALKF